LAVLLQEQSCQFYPQSLKLLIHPSDRLFLISFDRLFYSSFSNF
jgi:hypothetical protein